MLNGSLLTSHFHSSYHKIIHLCIWSLLFKPFISQFTTQNSKLWFQAVIFKTLFIHLTSLFHSKLHILLLIDWFLNSQIKFFVGFMEYNFFIFPLFWLYIIARNSWESFVLVSKKIKIRNFKLQSRQHWILNNKHTFGNFTRAFLCNKL